MYLHACCVNLIIKLELVIRLVIHFSDLSEFTAAIVGISNQVSQEINSWVCPQGVMSYSGARIILNFSVYQVLEVEQSRYPANKSHWLTQKLKNVR